MLLTCPTCRSGLEVPDGTTAQVRCPTCRTVFGPAEGAAAPPPPPPRPAAPAPKPARPRADEDDDRPRRRPRARDDEDDDARPRRKRKPAEVSEVGPYDEPGDEELERRRAEERRKRRRQLDEESKLTPEERRRQRAQFTRGMWGCKLLHAGFCLYAISLFIVLAFFVMGILFGPVMGLVVVAGFLGLLNWVLSAVGVGLCISSRPSTGHYGYGVAAAAGVLVHAVLMIAAVVRATGETVSAGGGETIESEYLAWANVPSQLHILTFYLAQFIYPDEGVIRHGAFTPGLIAGVAELIRLMLVMMLVSCLARAAGDEELSFRCTRAAGIGTFGPGGLAAAVLAMVAFLIETGGFDTTVGKILMYVLVLGIYAILAGMLVPSVVACQETADACEFPGEAKGNLVP